MIYPAISCENPFPRALPRFSKPPKKPSSLTYSKPIRCFQHPHNPIAINKPTIFINPSTVNVKKKKKQKMMVYEKEERGFLQVVGSRQMLLLCGFGYWVQGFRCFPWLALNFHMANNLSLHPSILQLVQNSGNLPMVAKPLYGILSDAIYIGGAHRIPYIVIGVLLQVLSWGPLALVPVASQVLPNLIAFVLLSNLGASITEVAKDALIAEYGQIHKTGGLQSYVFMALAAGGILGNLIGGFFLRKLRPRTMFLLFSCLLSLQLAISSSTKEDSLGLPKFSRPNLVGRSISQNMRNQLSNLVSAINDEKIFLPLTWIVGSIAMVPILSGSIFCYHTQCLNLDPSVIGLSRVTGQLMLLSGTVLFDRYWKKVPMRKLISIVQILYAASLLLDLVLVRQINLKLGIPNEVFALCFSSFAETLAQFKLLPFSVLFASLCPRGCEGSLTSFFASAVCLSSIVSGFLGVGLASLLGITSGDYSGLTMGILIQFLAALVPLRWIDSVPMSQPVVEKGKRRGLNRRTRKNRRIGKVVFGSIYACRRESESDESDAEVKRKL